MNAKKKVMFLWQLNWMRWRNMASIAYIDFSIYLYNSDQLKVEFIENALWVLCRWTIKMKGNDGKQSNPQPVKRPAQRQSSLVSHQKLGKIMHYCIFYVKVKCLVWCIALYTYSPLVKLWGINWIGIAPLCFRPHSIYVADRGLSSYPGTLGNSVTKHLWMGGQTYTHFLLFGCLVMLVWNKLRSWEDIIIPMWSTVRK